MSAVDGHEMYLTSRVCAILARITASEDHINMLERMFSDSSREAQAELSFRIGIIKDQRAIDEAELTTLQRLLQNVSTVRQTEA